MNVILRKSLQMLNTTKPTYSTNFWRAASIHPPRQLVRNVLYLLKKNLIEKGNNNSILL